MLHVTKSDRELAITPHVPAWLLALTWVFIVLAPITVGIAIYAFVGGPKTYTISCSRAERVCHVPRGGDLDLDDIKSVGVDTGYGGRNQGVVSELQVKLRDGKTRTISPDDAQDAESVAEYKAAAKAVTDFLASPDRAALDVKFSYRPSGPQLFGMVMSALWSIALAVVLRSVVLTRGARFALDKKTLALAAHGPLRRPATRTIPFADIARIVDVRGKYRALAVEVSGERVVVVQSSLYARASELDAAAVAIGEALGKPVETVAV